MKKIFFSSIFFLIFSQVSVFASGGHAVGNGGDGLLQPDGSVHLRDLVEGGMASNPSFVAAPDLSLVPRLRKIFDDPSFPVSLISAKLSELDQVAPGLKGVFLVAMERFSWWLIDQRLEPVPDDGTPVTIDPARLVQIANRLQASIRIDRTVWEKVPPSHRVALVFHETVFSLLDPEPLRDGSFGQSPRRARQITAALFAPGLLARDRATLSAVFASDLAIPPLDDLARTDVQSREIVRAGFRVKSADGKPIFFDMPNFDAVLFDTVSKQACAEAVHALNAGQAVEMLVERNPANLLAQIRPFRSAFGSQFQVRVRLDPSARSNRVTFPLQDEDRRACAADLLRALRTCFQ